MKFGHTCEIWSKLRNVAGFLLDLLFESLDEGGWCSILRHHLDAPVMDVIAGWQAWVSGKEGESESDGGVRAEG